jgi:hypothetical protein
MTVPEMMNFASVLACGIAIGSVAVIVLVMIMDRRG